MSDDRGMIECLGCVRLDGKPFVEIVNTGPSKGQCTPDEAIEMGTQFIMAGIEAERDAGVVRGMLDEGKTPEEVGRQLVTIRKYRDSYDPHPGGSHKHPRFPS